MLKPILCAGFFSATFTLSTMWSDGGLPRVRRLQRALTQAEADNAHLAARLDKVNSDLQAINHNRTAQEIAIRDELGWVKHKTDLILHFPE